MAAEGAKYRDEVVHEDGEHTHVTLQLLESQHHHHHVHEVVVPILNKRTALSIYPAPVRRG